jgi:hypothetical protein
LLVVFLPLVVVVVTAVQLECSDLLLVVLLLVQLLLLVVLLLVQLLLLVVLLYSGRLL